MGIIDSLFWQSNGLGSLPLLRIPLLGGPVSEKFTTVPNLDFCQPDHELYLLDSITLTYGKVTSTALYNLNHDTVTMESSDLNLHLTVHSLKVRAFETENPSVYKDIDFQIEWFDLCRIDTVKNVNWQAGGGLDMHFGTVILNITEVSNDFDAAATLPYCNLVYELLVFINNTSSFVAYTGSDVTITYPSVKVKSTDETLDLLTNEFTIRAKAERN